MLGPITFALQRAVTALLALSVLLSACTTLDRSAHADALAVPAHLTREQVEAGSFVLTAFARIARPDQPLTIYIEGDGLAWVSSSEPSADPTPREATGLALAAADPSPNIVYLARPCQFTPRELSPICGVRTGPASALCPR